MGDSRSLEKLRCLLRECHYIHVFKGVIEGIEPADYAPRVTKKILVGITGGKRRVNFTDPSIYGTDSVAGTAFLERLKIGQIVTILGKQHKKDQSSTAPIIVLLPEERLVLLTKERSSWTDVSTRFLLPLMSIAALLIAISQMNLYFGLLASITALILMIAAFGYEQYMQRPRKKIMLQVDQSLWEKFILEISDHFDFLY